MPSYLAIAEPDRDVRDVSGAVLFLFEGFRDRPRPETEWIERVLAMRRPTKDQIDREIQIAIDLYLPNLPDESRDYVVHVLRTAVNAVRQGEAIPRG
jgi:hypothetical protein